MQKRRFGRTNHLSTLAIFGAVALGKLDQTQADDAIKKVIDSGINHIDIAPSYGEAEARLSPWIPAIRKDFFIGCKTMERSKNGAILEFNSSLERLNMTHFDLYQMHAVTNMDELDACTAKNGALEGIVRMREEGLTDFIGITGHGLAVPSVFIEALRRFDFDSILFPINPSLFSNTEYRKQALQLLDLCEEKDVGVMIIKSVAKEPWGDEEHAYHTWYKPFDQQERIQTLINFALSQKLSHICTPGDYRLLDKSFRACQNFTPLSSEEQDKMIEKYADLEVIFNH
jgi:predicted aldo/keto reductase-like oxidoreductase